jgi:hypothetical protein
VRLVHCTAFLLAAAAPPAFAQSREPAVQQIATHDNLRPAGRLQDGVLSLSLWVGLGDWYPEGEASRPRLVAAFGNRCSLFAHLGFGIDCAPMVRADRQTASEIELSRGERARWWTVWRLHSS